MNANTEYQILHRFIRERLRDIHTIKPGVVTAVNDFTVNVKPLTTTKYRDGTQLPIATLEDVPLMIPSAGMGETRMTMPIKEGDLVIVLMSDRDYDDMLSSEITKDSIFPGMDISPLGLNPVMAIPSFFTEPQGKAIDKENIVIENKQSKVTIAPDGNVTIDSQGDTVVNTQGNFEVNASQINLNAPVNISGDTDIGGALTAVTVASATVNLDTHIHPVVGDKTGPAQPEGSL